MRINKFIANSGYCSRRNADLLLEQGKVFVNGKLATKGIDISENDEVLVEGKKIKLEEAKKYYDEHKSEIGNTPFETIKAAIVNEIVYQKQTEIVHKYYNDLAEKYKINDILNKEYPQEAANTGNTKTEEKK